MHHNIYNSTCKLILRQRIHQFRIHHCKLRTHKITVCTCFLSGLLICQYSRITHLTSCCRNRKYNSNRKCLLNWNFTTPEFFQICSRFCCCDCNCFSSINTASSTNCHNQISARIDCLFHAFFCKGHSWIRLHASKFFHFDSFCF